jgi:anti-sigma B factor antagonist
MTVFGVTREGDQQHPVLVLSGEIDMASVDMVLEAALPCLADGAKQMSLDFARVTFIDSTGLGALVTIHHTAQQAGVQLMVREVPDPVVRLLELTALDTLLAYEGQHDGHPRASGDPN